MFNLFGTGPRFDWKAIRYWESPLLRKQTPVKTAPKPPADSWRMLPA